MPLFCIFLTVYRLLTHEPWHEVKYNNKLCVSFCKQWHIYFWKAEDVISGICAIGNQCLFPIIKKIGSLFAIIPNEFYATFCTWQWWLFVFSEVLDLEKIIQVIQSKTTKIVWLFASQLQFICCKKYPNTPAIYCHVTQDMMVHFLG